VRAEVEQRVRVEILAQPAVEGAEGVRGREAALEQQPHRIAFVTERGLHADEDVAEALAQHMDRGAVRLLATGCGAPLRLDLREVGFAAHVIVHEDARVDVAVRTVARGVAGEDRLAQRVHGGGHVDRVARRLEFAQRGVDALEHA